MPKVTSKLQFTIPKAVAEKARVRVGDELDCQAVGNVILLRPRRPHPCLSVEERLASFDASIAATDLRWAGWSGPVPTDRGWTRADAYGRGEDDDLGV